MKLDWSIGALAEGLRCYQNQEFFLAHEHWESVWLKCQEPEKSFVQALILIASGCHHFQRNNLRGATSMLNKALRRLESYPPLFERVELAPLRAEVEIWLAALGKPDSTPHIPFPQIRLNNLSI